MNLLQVARMEESGDYVPFKDSAVVEIHPSTTLIHRPEWVIYNESVLTTRHFIRTITRIERKCYILVIVFK
jgi:pre-mRNA-splicing factor ATP-dependent RNA helicase DHX15/PRP43